MTGSAAGNFLHFARPDITEAEVDAAAAAIRSGWLTTGTNAAAFEREFAEFVGGDVLSVAVSSATAGLHLSLEALGIGLPEACQLVFQSAAICRDARSWSSRWATR